MGGLGPGAIVGIVALVATATGAALLGRAWRRRQMSRNAKHIEGSPGPPVIEMRGASNGNGNALLSANLEKSDSATGSV